MISAKSVNGLAFQEPPTISTRSFPTHVAECPSRSPTSGWLLVSHRTATRAGYRCIKLLSHNTSTAQVSTASGTMSRSHGTPSRVS